MIEMTVTDAAHRLARSYNQTMRLVLRQELQGRRDERGRWLVTTESVERYQRARATVAA